MALFMAYKLFSRQAGTQVRLLSIFKENNNHRHSKNSTFWDEYIYITANMSVYDFMIGRKQHEKAPFFKISVFKRLKHCLCLAIPNTTRFFVIKKKKRSNLPFVLK